MSDATRRGFLAAAGAGAATVAAVAAAPAALAGSARSAQRLDGSGEPLLAYVRDAAEGEVALMVGEREVVVHDPDLVARLTRAAGR